MTQDSNKMPIPKEVQGSLDKSNEAFRGLLGELNGKVMNYETCRMLEDFWRDYNQEIFSRIQEGITIAVKQMKKEGLI